MYGVFREFIYDEDGAASLDSMIVLGGSLWMAFAVVSDIAEASIDLTNDINERLEYASIIAEIVGEYGPGGTQDKGSSSTPNAVDNWGDGSRELPR